MLLVWEYKITNQRCLGYFVTNKETGSSDSLSI